MSLGDRIRTLRLSQNLTLQKLSEKIDISVSFLSDIEHNRSKPSLARLKEIAGGLNTCVSYLLDEENWINPNSVQNHCHLSNILYNNDLVSDEISQKIIAELLSVKFWPESEKLDLLNFIQSKNKQLLKK
ncbi:MAG: hypothetical protein A2Y24_05565 [Clostridiales bacterium GWE2_32_10]|nr:MAG: hypothetical protein A2Y24_05565 [Clostridiales bacterium GWE2_32_10]HBY20473.1 hypothetical protein [Clostridiales bacterium]